MQSEPSKADPPKRKRRRFQFSLRSLLLFTLVCAIACGWLGKKIEQKRQEREAVEAIVRSGGIVRYDYQNQQHQKPPGPDWLLNFIGHDFFAEVDEVALSPYSTGAERKYLERFLRLRTLTVPSNSDADAVLVHLKSNRVQKLFLGQCKITDAGLQHLDRLRQLEELYLGRSNIDDSGLSRIMALTQLRVLNLRETNVSDSGLVNIETLTNLEELDLAVNNIGDPGVSRLARLTNLRVLSLDDTDITDAGLMQLGCLTHLRWLSLWTRNVTDAGLTHLKGLTELQVLKLWETKITDSGLVNLKGLSKLQSLDLAGSKVTNAGVKDLQKALPNCCINH